MDFTPRRLQTASTPEPQPTRKRVRHIPKLRLPRLTLQRPTSWRTFAAYYGKFAVVCTVLVLGILSAYFYQTQRMHLGSADTAGGQTNATRSTTPTYTTLLPAGKSIQQLGGWRQGSPGSQDVAYAYRDMLDGSPIIVNEQKLPDSWLVDPEPHVADLAKKSNATDTLSAGGTTVHIANSDTGAQSLVFTKSGLLVLIYAPQKHSDATWILYIASLKS